MKNPFVFSKIVTGADFCRRAETARLRGYMEDGVNVVLYSKRRFGKSSLIKEIFENELDESKYIGIYADIFSIVSESDFAQALYKAAASAVKTDAREALRTLKSIFSRVSFSVKLSAEGGIEFAPALASRDFEEILDDVFSGLEAFATRQDKKIVFAIDEFQQIAEIKGAKIEHALRSRVQTLSRVSFVFCGSKRHMLTRMFQERERPFYHQAAMFELGAIGREDFYEFARLKFENSGKELSEGTFDEIYELARGETWLVQNICYHLWESGADNAEEALREIARMNDGGFRAIFCALSGAQKAALKLVAKYGGEKLLSREALGEFGFSKGTTATALDALCKQEIIEKSGEKYEICDRLFELWLKWTED